MQKRTWKQTLCSAGGVALLLAVLPLVLGIFTPRLSQCLAAEVSQPRETATGVTPFAGLKIAATAEEAVVDLDAWVDTYNPTPAQLTQSSAQLKAEYAKYKVDRAIRYNHLLTIYEQKYSGERLHTYLVLLYKNLTIENINFIKYQYHQVVNLYRDGFVSTSPYRFVALR